MLRHMACKVTPSPKGIDHIAFLYQLTPGSCPKSYGMNVAQLAGLPIDVIERAVQVSMQFFAKRTEDAPDEEDVCSKQIQAVQALTTAHEDLVALWKRVTQLVSKSAD